MPGAGRSTRVRPVRLVCARCYRFGVRFCTVYVYMPVNAHAHAYHSTYKVLPESSEVRQPRPARLVRLEAQFRVPQGALPKAHFPPRAPSACTAPSCGRGRRVFSSARAKRAQKGRTGLKTPMHRQGLLHADLFISPSFATLTLLFLA